MRTGYFLLVPAGDAIWNPLTGEKAMLVESAEETEGARIVGDFGVEAGGFVPGGEHVHDHCAEHFEVRAGRMAFVRGGEERVLEAILGAQARSLPRSERPSHRAARPREVARARHASLARAALSAAMRELG